MSAKTYKNPAIASDTIIELSDGGIVLIERKNEPFGWAIPGGFIDYGESAEEAAIREAKEETGLDVTLVEQFKTYSSPGRDPRGHTITIIFIVTGSGTPVAADDAKNAGVFHETNLPANLAFDHPQVLGEYFEYKRSGRRPTYKNDEGD